MDADSAPNREAAAGVVDSGTLMDEPKAIIFDLYGTLLHVGRSSIHRALPRALGIRPALWFDLAREELLSRSFESDEEMARFICDRLVPGREELVDVCCEIVARERDSIRPIDGGAAVLAFFRRRGWKTGLISNLSSSYVGAVERFQLAEMLDVTTFSCEVGIRKPDSRIYLDTLDRLGVTADRAVMVGDSLPLDVEAPQSLGMRAVHVGEAAGTPISQLGLFDLDALLQTGEVSTLLGDGSHVAIDGLVADDDQGRYNLVWRGRDRGTGAGIYVKRYMLPESAWVERLAWQMYAELDMPRCAATVIDHGEPLLVVSEAAGEKYPAEIEVDPPLARELGRHIAFAYLFSNADIRPRNAFVDRNGPSPLVTMIDLEHCFFDLAIDVSGIADPFDPAAIDAAMRDGGRVAKRVLTDRAMRRASRSFVQEESLTSAAMGEFRAGFRELFAVAAARSARILSIVSDRVASAPFLSIGTHAWRRAMCRADVEGLRVRLNENPDDVLSRFC